MPRAARTRPVSGAQVRSYASKAEEFAEASEANLDAGRYVAATSLAIHAGISSADAVCGARIGQRAAGDNHDQALVMLGEAGRDGADVQRHLRRLLPLKSRAEYEPDEIAAGTAAKAVEQAQRCAAVAHKVAATTR